MVIQLIATVLGKNLETLPSINESSSKKLEAFYKIKYFIKPFNLAEQGLMIALTILSDVGKTSVN